MANSAKYKAKLLELRTKHEEFQKKHGDLGAIPEKELLAKWWNGKEKPPKTSEPILSFKEEKLTIKCETKGASIGFKKHGNDKSWEVYSKPILFSKGDSILVIAHRIGFEPSENLKTKTVF